MSIFQYFSILMVFTAAFSYVNHRYLKLPSTIGVMLISLLVSLMLIAAGQVFTDTFIVLCEAVETMDFTEVLLDVLLGFLIFAGAYESDTRMLFKERRMILLMATFSTVFSTFMVGYLIFWACSWIGAPIPLVHALLFGALISPTDPIAVLAILKKAQVPKSIETDIAGESLFNDGVAVVIFLTLLNIAQSGSESIEVSQVATLFFKEVFGGGLLGLAIGWMGTKLIQSVKDAKISIIITLAVVMGGYTAAEMMHVSGILALVAAGLLMSYRRARHDFREETEKQISIFWSILDDILNALLFLFIGIEMLDISHDFQIEYLWMGLMGVLVVLLSRAVSVLPPLLLSSQNKKHPRQVYAILVWGGLRGGISVALALSLGEEINGELLVSITYVIVLFSIIVQGLTVGPLVKKIF